MDPVDAAVAQAQAKVEAAAAAAAAAKKKEEDEDAAASQEEKAAREAAFMAQTAAEVAQNAELEPEALNILRYNDASCPVLSKKKKIFPFSFLFLFFFQFFFYLSWKAKNLLLICERVCLLVVALNVWKS